MDVNAIGQLAGSYKVWDHEGIITPNFIRSEGFHPAQELNPAPWLPVSFYDRRWEVWKVIMSGKLVALDNDGWVVPAQYGLGAATITYTADDVTAGVIDVRTGVALVTGGIGTFNVAAVTSYMGDSGKGALAVSDYIGAILYDAFQYHSDNGTYDDGCNPVGYRQLNFNVQHRVAVMCDAYIEMPLIPASQTATNLGQLTKAAGVNILDGAALGNLPVATNTTHTPIAFTNGTGTDAATRFVRQVATRADITAAGQWFIDYETGIVSVYGTATIVANVYQVAYYHYAGNPATLSVFACALGDLKPGDFVQCGTGSNYVVDAAATVAATVGQVWARMQFPRDHMDRVMTPYKPALSGFSGTGAVPGTGGQFQQAAGSATGGMPANIHYSGASDTAVRINFFGR